MKENNVGASIAGSASTGSATVRCRAGLSPAPHLTVDYIPAAHCAAFPATAEPPKFPIAYIQTARAPMK